MNKKDYNRIYAYTTIEVSNKEWEGNRKGRGLIKVGQTSQDVLDRVKQQLQGSPHLLNGGYSILFDEEAINIHGEYFKDIDVFRWLRLMKIQRIPRTEWFEATIEDVRKAFEYTASCRSGRTLSYKGKNTAEQRGTKYNKKEAQTERKKLGNYNNILKIMTLYPEATSILKITKKFIPYYKIKQFSITTASNIIGEAIGNMKKESLIINKGTKQFPNLQIIEGKHCTQFLEDLKPTLTLKELKSLIKNIKEGLTVKDIEERYRISNKSCLYEILEKNFVKIKNKGSLNRYVHPSNYKKPKPLQELKDNIDAISYTDIDVFNVRKALKGTRRKGNNQKNPLCKDIASKAGISVPQLECIIKNEFLKLHITRTGAIAYKFNYCSNKAEREEKKKEELETNILKIKALLEGLPRGLNTAEISKKLNWSYSRTFRVITETKKRKEFQKVGEQIILSKYEIDPFIKLFPAKAMRTALKHGITKKDFIDIITDNPYCTSIAISKILVHKFNLPNSDGYFDEVVAAAKRELLKEDVIVCTSKQGNLHIKDETHQVSLSKVALEIPSLLTFIRSFKTGATMKDIYNFTKGKISLASLYHMLKKIPEIQPIRVCSENTLNVPYYLKWFLVKQNICLNQDEELFDAIEWIG